MRTPLPPNRRPRRKGLSSADFPIQMRFGGRAATVRWLAPDDTELLAFFASHMPETIYQRYGYAGVRMTPERAARLVAVDQSRDAALGVFESDAAGPRLIAIGRYCLMADRQSAELAFVVHEQRHRLGIGSALLAALIGIGRERGLARLIAEVQHDNAPMLGLLRAAGATLHWDRDTATIEATLPLHQTPECAPAGPDSPRKRPFAWAADITAPAALQLERASSHRRNMPTP